MMCGDMDRMRALYRELRAVRAHNGDVETAEEERLLDEMDDVWWSLSEDQRDLMRAEQNMILELGQSKDKEQG